MSQRVYFGHGTPEEPLRPEDIAAEWDRVNRAIDHAERRIRGWTNASPRRWSIEADRIVDADGDTVVYLIELANPTIDAALIVAAVNRRSPPSAARSAVRSNGADPS